MYKLLNLYRINFYNRILIIGYYIRKIFNLNIPKKVSGLNDYYNGLIRTDGIQIGESKDTYLTKLKNIGSIFKIRKRPSSDIDVLEQIFNHNQYQHVVESYKKAFGCKTLNIIDAGANIGLASIYFKIVFKDSNLISIEPEQNNLEILKENMLLNNINANVLNAGLWSKSTYLKILKDFRNNNDWSFRVEETNDTSNGIYAVTINQILKDNNWEVLDILKVDIEGSEKEVFASNESDVSFLKKTKCIAIEIHDEFNCREAIYKVLEKYNFDYFNSGELTIGIKKT